MEGPFPYAMTRPPHFQASAPDVFGLPQIGGRNYDQNNRFRKVPSLKIKSPLAPTGVAKATRASTCGLRAAGNGVREVSRNACDRSPTCPGARCSMVMGGFLHACRSCGKPTVSDLPLVLGSLKVPDASIGPGGLAYFGTTEEKGKGENPEEQIVDMRLCRSCLYPLSREPSHRSEICSNWGGGGRGTNWKRDDARGHSFGYWIERKITNCFKQCHLGRSIGYASDRRVNKTANYRQPEVPNSLAPLRRRY